MSPLNENDVRRRLRDLGNQAPPFTGLGNAEATEPRRRGARTGWALAAAAAVAALMIAPTLVALNNSSDNGALATAPTSSGLPTAPEDSGSPSPSTTGPTSEASTSPVDSPKIPDEGSPTPPGQSPPPAAIAPLEVTITVVNSDDALAMTPLRDRAIFWSKKDQAVYYLNENGASPTCPPEGSAKLTEDGQLALVLTKPAHIPGKLCSLANVPFYVTITNVTGAPRQLTVQDRNSATRQVSLPIED